MSTFLTIPLSPGIADQQIDISLDNKLLTLRVTWNDLGGYWYLVLSHRDGNTIVGTVKMVKNFPLLERYKLAVPAGELIFFDNNSGKLRPDFDSLGRDHLLIYRSPD